MPGLEQAKLFSTLNPAEWETVFASALERKLPADYQIFKEGDPGDGMYVVAEGLVQISAIVGDGERKVLSRLGAGDFFGEMSVLDSEPRSACASTEQESTLYFIPREKMLAMLENSPRLAFRLVREFSLRMREFNRQYVKELLQAERLSLVGRFASSIVHDLKNPLNIIGLSAELVRMEKATPEMRVKASERIQKQVQRLSGMIMELLEFTRGSQQSVVLEPVNYRAYVREIIDDLQPEAQDKKVTLVLRNDPPDREVLIDQRRLDHVFANLINNAADVLKAGGKVYFDFAEDGPNLVTHVEDTGPGLPPQIAARLFEPFATFGKTNGTGLGLSICKRIIEDHKGWIRARNEPGRGAIFTFALPLKK